ncbi:MAG TPA: pantoate--beta-alanine ligase [Streptosporangiaceae bacterium]
MLARTRRGLAAARRSLEPPVVLVPTMGALHEGHRALLRCAKSISQPNGSVLVSVFVNPLQFGAGEDLDRYPQTLDADVRACAEEGVDVVFAPDRAQMYPGEQLITVDPGPMGQVLEGASRPGHFRGVLTVVLKLFHLTRPQVAVFGEKDAQQLALIRRMTDDLDLDVRIESVPTVRDADGLAISSRNAHLSDSERASALALNRALRAGASARPAGPEAVLAAAGQVLEEAARATPAVTLDYLELVDPGAFTLVKPGHAGSAVLVVAGRVGLTRLIDNMPMVLGDLPGRDHGIGDAGASPIP